MSLHNDWLLMVIFLLDDSEIIKCRKICKLWKTLIDDKAISQIHFDIQNGIDVSPVYYFNNGNMLKLLLLECSSEKWKDLLYHKHSEIDFYPHFIFEDKTKYWMMNGYSINCLHNLFFKNYEEDMINKIDISKKIDVFNFFTNKKEKCPYNKKKFITFLLSKNIEIRGEYIVYFLKYIYDYAEKNDFHNMVNNCGKIEVDGFYMSQSDLILLINLLRTIIMENDYISLLYLSQIIDDKMAYATQFILNKKDQYLIDILILKYQATDLYRHFFREYFEDKGKISLICNIFKSAYLELNDILMTDIKTYYIDFIVDTGLFRDYCRYAPVFIIEEFIKKGCNPLNKLGFESACAYNNISVVKYLYSFGNKFTQSMFNYAYKYKHVELLLFMINTEQKFQYTKTISKYLLDFKFYNEHKTLTKNGYLKKKY